MTRFFAGAAILAAVAAVLMGPVPRRIVHQLPAGVVEARDEMIVESGGEVRGAPEGTILRMSPDFRGRAAIVARGAGIRIHDLIVEGNRDSRDDRSGLPPSNVPFARFTPANGVLALNVESFTVERVEFRNIAGFALLVSEGRRVLIDGVRVSASGSRNAAGRNNTTGGILLEEGVAEFQVTGCVLHNIRGNGIWTHSLYTSPRNGPGVIARNRIETVARDAIQVGHASGVRVEDNSGWRIGMPAEDVDIEARAYPVAIDTAGNVDHSVYAGNRFEEINGKCIDLDGFHDGEVRQNTCTNRAPPESYGLGNFGIVMNNTNPDMRPDGVRIVENTIDGAQFGGIFVIGTGNTVARNRLLNLNRAHCNEEAARFGCYYAAGEPDMLRSGIYLGKGAERPAPARGNVIESNEITGFEMRTRCIGRAPEIAADWNVVRNNDCR